MEIFAGMYVIITIVVLVFAIGTFFALPMIWYHVGFISRKLDRVVKLLEELRSNR